MTTTAEHPMLEDVLWHIHNWFEYSAPHVGDWEIEDGTLPLDFVDDDQYFRIEGSIHNDGLHLKGDTLTDEEWHGLVTPLAIPERVVSLSDEIAKWCEDNPRGAYTSESFGGYSYSRASSKDGTGTATWADVFSTDLEPWRKLS